MPARYFTLAEANRTLPLVRRIVADITERYPRWRELVAQYELAAARARPDWGEGPEQQRLRLQVEAVAREINAFLQELEQVGCVFKGFDLGLVDFPGRLGDRDVLWCWKQGEEEIRHYHDVEAGYAGRQVIPEVVRT